MDIYYRISNMSIVTLATIRITITYFPVTLPSLVFGILEIIKIY